MLDFGGTVSAPGGLVQFTQHFGYAAPPAGNSGSAAFADTWLNLAPTATIDVSGTFVADPWKLGSAPAQCSKAAR